MNEAMIPPDVPKEIAHACVFLASEESSYITGTELVVVVRRYMISDFIVVGALRAQAPDEDLTYLEGGGIKTHDVGARPTMGDMAKRMSEAYSSENWMGEVDQRG